MRLRRVRRVLAVNNVYGRPDLVAVLYAGDRFYTYVKR